MLDSIDVFLKIVGIFFIIYLIGYSSFLFFSVIVGSSKLYRVHRQKRFENYFSNDYYVPITVIVPAYNEEVTVVETVKSLLNLDYRSYEIVVVDDGSKDNTSKALIEGFSMHLVQRPIRRQVFC